jgi:hypothetical protein
MGVVLTAYLFSCLALMALDAPDSPPASSFGSAAGQTTPEAGTETEAEGRRQAAQAQYNALRERTPATAAAQWKLALWCEQNGLLVEAYTHFAAVVQHDPKREAAWHKLGFKKHDGRWMTDEQIAEQEEHKKADKVWGPRLKKWHAEIHQGKHQAEAEAEIARISDPKAVAPVYREFGGGGEQDQLILVQILGQIDSPVASKTLAALAIYGRTPEVRRRATETLRGRSAEEFLDLLIAMMVDPIKYMVLPVVGPGLPGALIVEGERANMRRIYAPPLPPPGALPLPGELISYDATGMPVVFRSGSGGPAIDPVASQNLVEARKGAIAAGGQLLNDAARIEALNEARNNFNNLVMQVAKDATGKDLGKTPKEWREARAADPKKYVRRPERTPAKPTLSELALLEYNPVFVDSTVSPSLMFGGTSFLQHHPPHT